MDSLEIFEIGVGHQILYADIFSIGVLYSV